MGTKNFKPAVVTATLLVAALSLLASGIADAHGHRARVGVFFGFPGPFYYPGPAYYPYYYPPAYYPPPTVVVPPPAEYLEQTPPAAVAPPAPPAPSAGAPTAPSAQGPGAANYYWYYCPDSQTYYPYVQTCASQWQQVTPRTVPPS
jgi:hypothetical protein